MDYPGLNATLSYVPDPRKTAKLHLSVVGLFLFTRYEFDLGSTAYARADAPKASMTSVNSKALIMLRRLAIYHR